MRLLAAFACAVLLPAQPESSPVLVEHHFDGEDLATGPDTMLILQRAKGTVRLAEQYRVSGHRSVEIKAVAGDGEFPELQGYFAERKQGAVTFHFALLIANPQEKLNIALAGPAHFNLSKSGLAFWLTTQNAKLAHVTAGSTEELFAPRPFAWYLVDVVYRIDSGRYDLTVREEGVAEPLVSLTGQQNASGKGGSLDRYSFVSNPFRDDSNVLYYVDDVVIAADTPVDRIPLLAPGRRALFVDRWDEYRRRLAAKPGCIPVTALADLGARGGDQPALLRAAEGEPAESADPLVRAALEWRKGCDAASRLESEEALAHFDAAIALAPNAPMYSLSRVFALAGLKRWTEMEAAWSARYARWRDDPRFPLIAAAIGLSRGDLGEAESWLRPAAEPAVWRERISPAFVEALRKQMPDRWREALHNRMVAEEYFYVLLWQQRWALASEYAGAMASRLEAVKLPAPDWIERAGDAWFFAGDYRQALARYEESLGRNPQSTQAYLRLSDVWFRLGDLAKERQYREAIYGVLR